MHNLWTHLAVHFRSKSNTHSIFARLFLQNSNKNENFPKGTCDTSQKGRGLGGIWEAPGSSQRLQEAKGLQEAPNPKNRCLFQLECKSLLKSWFSIMFVRVTSPSIANYKMKCSTTAVNGATKHQGPLYKIVRTPTDMSDKFVWGIKKNRIYIYIYICIRRPPLWGPSGCEEWELDCILYPTYPFILHPCVYILRILIPASLRLHPSIPVSCRLYPVSCSLRLTVLDCSAPTE
jgi:hypothetical protein